MDITESYKISDVLRKSSRTSTVFHNYGIDFCCGGEDTLKQACEKSGALLTHLLADLRKELKTQCSTLEQHPEHPDVSNLALPELVDHIYQYHHSYLYANLPRISYLFQKVKNVHGNKHSYLNSAADMFNKLHEELIQHLELEERTVFPQLEFGDYTKADVESIQTDHYEVGELLDVLRKTMHDYEPPEGACVSFKILLEKLKTMERNIFDHVSEEQSLLFPAALNRAQ
ncbi:hypothetical protein P9112_012215 [Eukaryota sp. TZLM1-RC]